MKYCLPLCLCFLAITAPRGAAQDAPETKTKPTGKAVEIPASTEYTVGQKFELKSEATMLRETMVRRDGEELQHNTENVRGNLEATAEVLEVTKQKSVSKLKLTVTQFSIFMEEEEESPLKAGSEMIVERDKEGKVVCSVGGEPAEAKYQLILSQLVELGRESAEDAPSAAEAYGVDKPRAPGDSWEINPEALAKLENSKEKDLKIDPAKVGGRLSFRKLVDTGGVRCAEIALSMHLGFSKFPGLPKEFKVKSATSEMTGKFKQPLDKASVVPEENLDSDLKIVAEGKGPGDIALELTISVKRTSSTQRKQLP